ncbi:MAG: MurR/RpiR family transcriptional regulator [Roseibium sp.]
MTEQPPETFDALRQKIRDRFSDLTPHLQRIARASLEEPNSFALNTTSVIASTLEIQPSTLIRFAKEFNFKGFSDLQKVFRQRLIEGNAEVRERVLEKDAVSAPADTQAEMERCIAAHIESLNNLGRNCDIETLCRAVQLLRNANHIYIAGLRRSRPIADYLNYCLLRGERSCSLLDFAGGMAGPQIATISNDDILFAIAFSPYSKHVVDAVMDAHVSGRRIISLTDNAESPLANYADVVLLLGTDTRSRLQPISAAVALIQTLAEGVTKP